jgi:hypothetical protein
MLPIQFVQDVVQIWLKGQQRKARIQVQISWDVQTTQNVDSQRTYNHPSRQLMSGTLFAMKENTTKPNNPRQFPRQAKAA